ncbi:MAG TPA: GNAT family N-acetyltransferase [Gammaproteobacteria bacterium]|nr:GNAT family N-acetyltransferase [Gammaproteobacteria bacterium]
MEGPIRDNRRHSRYEIEKDGKVAFVTYKREPGIITFIHAEVPKELSGHGVGTALVREVLDIARTNGDKVIPVCPFIAAYMRHHKETQDLLADPTYLEAHATK